MGSIVNLHPNASKRGNSIKIHQLCLSTLKFRKEKGNFLLGIYLETNKIFPIKIWLECLKTAYSYDIISNLIYIILFRKTSKIDFKNRENRHWDYSSNRIEMLWLGRWQYDSVINDQTHCNWVKLLILLLAKYFSS